jgi:hypothetical protein
MSLGAASLAGARELLVMPFECGLERGRVKLSPAADTRYRIVAKRQEVAVTRCSAPPSTRCRTVVAHRFDISCGGGSVAWMRVAAAIKSTGAPPAWIEGGRLNVVLPAVGSHAAWRSCMEPPTYALGRTASPRRGRHCRHRANDFEHVVLPPGFAPVGELGARLEPAGTGAAALSGGSGEASFRRVADRGETRIARADPDAIIMEPLPQLEPFGADIDVDAYGAEWVTVVRSASEYGSVAQDGGGALGPWAWLLGAMALATAAGIMRVRSPDAWPDGLVALAPRLDRLLVAIRWWRSRDAASMRDLTNAGAALTALLEQTETVVSELKGAGPLREVLQSELQLVRQRLACIEDAAGDGEEADARTAPQYRALARELERIGRIVDSAAASLSGARRAGSMPRTTSEAYDVLGVNPDVSEGVLKKIVGALRMSWHPDHARSDEDRLVREDRIRRINIAWDLINAKREAA